MRFERDDGNVRDYLASAKYCTRKQILTMFRNVNQSWLEAFLFLLTQQKDLKYDETAQIYRPMQCIPMHDTLKKRCIMAGWVIAWLGAEKIMSFQLMKYPLDYYVSLMPKIVDNRVVEERDFVLSVVGSREGALDARRCFLDRVIDGGDVEHIAVLYDAEDAEKYRLKECGFDRWCVLDPETRKPEFHEL